MSDTYNVTDATALLTIYNAETAEERSCTQEEFETTFEPEGWEIIEPIGDLPGPLATLTLTNPETGETKTITGQEWIDMQPKERVMWQRSDIVKKPRGAGALTEKQRTRLRTEEEERGRRDEGRDEERR